MKSTDIFREFATALVKGKLKAREPFKIREGKHLSIIARFNGEYVLVHWPKSDDCHEQIYSTYGDFLYEIEREFNRLVKEKVIKRCTWLQFYRANHFQELEEYWTRATHALWTVLTPNHPAYKALQRQETIEDKIEVFGWADAKAYSGDGDGEVFFVKTGPFYYLRNHYCSEQLGSTEKPVPSDIALSRMTSGAKKFKVEVDINFQTGTYKMKAVKQIQTW